MTTRRHDGGYVSHHAASTFVSVGVAARWLSCDPSVVRRHCASGRIPSASVKTTPGGHYRVSASWIRLAWDAQR